MRVRCRYCKRQHNYAPSDLIQVFGDVDVDSLAYRMKCENDADHGTWCAPPPAKWLGFALGQPDFLHTK
ncbi:hypothetical protein ORS3428_03735 [Mesorhizobium sp. ORS 3428]|nr:hypothetical protein ORS3428_03735 [Mesorhizobium sp. ORS 3428]